MFEDVGHSGNARELMREMLIGQIDGASVISSPAPVPVLYDDRSNEDIEDDDNDVDEEELDEPSLTSDDYWKTLLSSVDGLVGDEQLAEIAKLLDIELSEPPDDNNSIVEDATSASVNIEDYCSIYTTSADESSSLVKREKTVNIVPLQANTNRLEIVTALQQCACDAITATVY